MFIVNKIDETNKIAETKLVYCYGIPMIVPIWTKFIGVDPTGAVLAFQNAPYFDPEHSNGFSFDGDFATVGIKVTDYSGDWRDSVEEV